MLKQVEAYLNLRLTSDSMPDYLDWDELDAPEQHDKFRLLDLNHEDVVAINMEFCCRYMIRGFTFLFDLAARFPYESYDTATRMADFEMQIWCNMFCRMLHIDIMHLLAGVDTLALRKHIDGDLDTDNTAPFIDFLDEHRGPLRSRASWVRDSIALPNAWLATTMKQLMTDIGAGFQQRRWCSRHEYRTLKYPHRNLYVHATAHVWCLGQLTRYHQLFDFVGGCFWFPPASQCVLN